MTRTWAFARFLWAVLRMLAGAVVSLALIAIVWCGNAAALKARPSQYIRAAASPNPDSDLKPRLIDLCGASGRQSGRIASKSVPDAGTKSTRRPRQHCEIGENGRRKNV